MKKFLINKITYLLILLCINAVAQTQSRPDSTIPIPLGKGINMDPIKGRITNGNTINLTQDQRMQALITELSKPFDIPPRSSPPDLRNPCVVQAAVNPVPFVDPTGKLDSSCNCKNGGVFPLCKPIITCTLPQVFNALTGKCDTPLTCNAFGHSESWSGGNCSGIMSTQLNMAAGTTIEVNNTNSLSTASSKEVYQCNANGSLDLISQTCDPMIVQCTANGSMPWGDGCSADIALTVKKPGESISLTNTVAGYTPASSATWNCRADGTFQLGAYTCDKIVPKTCTINSGGKTWGAGCSGDFAAGGTYNPGASLSVSNTAPAYSSGSTLTYVCQSDGTWATSQTCDLLGTCTAPADVVKSLCPAGDPANLYYSTQAGFCDSSNNPGWAAAVITGDSSLCPSNKGCTAPANVYTNLCANGKLNNDGTLIYYSQKLGVCTNGVAGYSAETVVGDVANCTPDKKTCNTGQVYDANLNKCVNPGACPSASFDQATICAAYDLQDTGGWPFIMPVGVEGQTDEAFSVCSRNSSHPSFVNVQANWICTSGSWKQTISCQDAGCSFYRAACQAFQATFVCALIGSPMDTGSPSAMISAKGDGLTSTATIQCCTSHGGIGGGGCSGFTDYDVSYSCSNGSWSNPSFTLTPPDPNQNGGNN